MEDPIRLLELTTIEQWKEAFPIIVQLRSDLVENSYLDLLGEMQENGYRLFALISEGNMVALA